MSKPRSIVIVTGAGASHDLTAGSRNDRLIRQFPLGNQLANAIVARADDIAGCFLNTRKPTAESPDDAATLVVFLKDLVARLRTGVYDTVDEFVGANAGTPSASLAAFACAYVISEAEYNYVLGTSALHGWLRPLARLWAENAHPQSELDADAQSVKFVTFNYDRTIEWALALAYFGRHGGTLEAAVEVADKGQVAHMHGRTFLDHVRCFKGEPIESGLADFQRSARTIRLVHATSGRHNRECDDCETKQAIEWLKGADIIAFFGFGFAESCLAAIGVSAAKPLESWSSAIKVVTSWYDSEDALDRVKAMCSTKLSLPNEQSSNGHRNFWSCEDTVRTVIWASKLKKAELNRHRR